MNKNDTEKLLIFVAALSWIRTKGDVSVACVFDVARIVNFVVIEHKMFLSGILVL